MMTYDDLTDDTPTTFPVGWILIAVGLAAWLALGLTIIGDPGNGDKPVDAPSPCVDVTVPGSLPQVEPGAVCSHGGGL